jgi:hypothetical protein
MSEYDFEPIRGLPGVPPAGETILWQGAPNWWTLAREAFHIGAAAAYLAAMLAWRAASGMAGGESVAKALFTALSVAPIALAGLGMLAFLAWLNARTTVYTITSRRVVFRFGAALTKSINFPFGIIETGALKVLPGGAGDLALTLKAPNKIAFLQLWPHARPWRLTAPQPTLRCIPNAREIADLLAGAMRTQIPLELLQPEAANHEPSSTAGLRPAHARAG